MRTRVQTIPAFGASYFGAEGDRLASVRRWARLMDSQFVIPGTNIRFGLDPLVGLFLPGLGSVASSVVSLALISTMSKHGASRHLIIRMLLNVFLDTVVGAIPLIGNIFDFVYRANDRNVELLRQHYEEGRYQGSGNGLIAVLLGGLAVAAGLIVWGTVVAIEFVWHQLQGLID